MPTQEAKKHAKKTVVIADDQSLTRDMVRAILKSMGVENVLVAENGSIAITLIMDNKVDLAICDWNTPVVTGIDVLRKARSDDRYRKIPFLMLTAEAYRENLTQAIGLGVSDYVSKPFTAEVLTQKVLALLDAVKQSN